MAGAISIENTILFGCFVIASCKWRVMAGISLVACVLAVINVTSTKGLLSSSEHSISAKPPEAVNVGSPS